jgi:hypothetical protein
MTVKEIEKAIEKLSEDDLSDLREWFYKFDNEVWDKQFESENCGVKSFVDKFNLNRMISGFFVDFNIAVNTLPYRVIIADDTAAKNYFAFFKVSL